MDSNIVIAVVIGLVVGIGIAFLMRSKKTIDVTKENTNTFNEDALNKSIENLEQEKAALIKKLSTSENLLNSIQDANGTEGAEKLIKELKDLKDELEDLEDELEDQKRSNKKIREEKNEIEDEKNAVEKNVKLLSEEKDALEKEKSILKQESEQRNESLTFINNVLNAKSFSNNDYEKLEEETWEILYRIIEIIYEHLHDYDTEYFEYYAYKWRSTELKTWIKNKKKIAVVGEFSSGKTSIINRILSQDNPNAPLLPVSSKETTAIPTYISQSKDFNCQFFSPDNKLRNVSKETFGMVTKSILDKVNISHLIKYFVVSYDNKYLKNLSILDTPGFASNSDEIISRTVEVVREVDAVFWVIDANTGDINQTSIQVMKEHLNKLPLYFVINKSDTKSPGELDQLEAKIEQTALQNDINYEAIIRFSQKENVEVLMDHIQNIKIEEEEPLMRYILNSLDANIEILNEEKKKLLKKGEEIRDELDLITDNLEYIKDSIGDSARDIASSVEQKNSFWGGDKYQIGRDNYSHFRQALQNILELSSNIQEQVGFYSAAIEKNIINQEDILNKKQKLYKIKKDRDGFEKLITEYNANLLN